jgi:hypothetical protein
MECRTSVGVGRGSEGDLCVGDMDANEPMTLLVCVFLFFVSVSGLLRATFVVETAETGRTSLTKAESDASRKSQC